MLNYQRIYSTEFDMLIYLGCVWKKGSCPKKKTCHLNTENEWKWWFLIFTETRMAWSEIDKKICVVLPSKFSGSGVTLADSSKVLGFNRAHEWCLKNIPLRVTWSAWWPPIWISYGISKCWILAGCAHGSVNGECLGAWINGGKSLRYLKPILCHN